MDELRKAMVNDFTDMEQYNCSMMMAQTGAWEYILGILARIFKRRNR